MEDLLFLAHRIPYPPNKGDKIRSWHLLRHLASRYRVHLGCFVDDPQDHQHEPVLRALCASCHFAPLNPKTAKLGSLRGLLTGDALTFAWFRDPQLTRWVKETHAARPIAARSSASLFVSEAEADLLRRRPGIAAEHVHALGNGVDLEYFDGTRTYPDPYPPGGPVLVFTGMMDYRANVDAVLWFADAILPEIRARHPDARFAIVGAKPDEKVKRLAERPGIIVTGRVEDVRPYVAHAAVAVAPLRIARGIQNKVLEAMAMARPVVASAEAFEGIDAVAGEHLIVEDEPAAYADRI